MKAMTAAALALCLLFSAAHAQEELAGDWDIELDMAGNILPGKLTISVDGDAIKGTLTTQMGPFAIDKFNYEGGKITFTQTATILEQEMQASFEGALDGDSFSGTLTSDLGPMPVVGRRVAAPPSIVGSWSCTTVVSSQDLTLTRTLEIKKDLTGLYKGDGNEWTISDLTADGNSVRFAVTIQFNGQDMPLNFSGTVDGGSLKGSFFLDGTDVSQLTAVRAFDIRSIAGAWSVTVTGTPLGDFSHTAAINADGTGTYTSESEAPINNLKIDGDKVAFHATVKANGESHEVDFAGAIADGKIEGNVYAEGGPTGKLLMRQGGA
jgi:hypothetical protein